MKLIVGLGNPGKEYENTRHNIGFYMLDSYLGSNIDWKSKFDGLYHQTVINGEKVLFLKPYKFINLSGEVVRKYVDFFKVDIADILIIHDDLDLQVGTYRLRQSGRSAGHNGLKNIECHLGTQNYKRLKIGISNNKSIDTKDYVLGRINSEDINVFNGVSKIVNNIIEDFLCYDFSLLMNRYNHKN